jgi:hypothetical protein
MRDSATHKDEVITMSTRMVTMAGPTACAQQSHEQGHAHEARVGKSRHQRPQRRVVPSDARIQADGDAESHHQQSAKQVGEKHPGIEQLGNRGVRAKAKKHARQREKQHKPVQAGNGLQRQKLQPRRGVATQHQGKKGKGDTQDFEHALIVG